MRDALRTVVCAATLLLPVRLFAQWNPTTGGLYTNGNVGIGASSNPPQSLLYLASPDGASAIQFKPPGTQTFRFTSVGVPNWGGLTMNAKYSYPSGWTLDDPNYLGYFLKLDGRGGNPVSNGLWLYVIPAGAYTHTDEGPLFGVVNGTTYMAGTASIGGFSGGNAPPAPTDTLRVYGSIRADGSITGGSVIGATYQDVAEWVPVPETLQAGTVVVLNAANGNEVMPSTTAYDTTVAGVVSEHPGIILGKGGPDKAQVATTGRVKVKVDATRASIRVGDLLVTSDVAGTAMKSEPIEINGRRFHQPGTIIGKALEPLASGTGEILVLLSLQ